ncbi:phage protein, partial [Burkholderia cenocepacia]
MGRNKQETTVVPADNTLEVLPALTEAANTLAARSSEIAKQFGDGLPYERHRVVNEARFYMAQSAEAMLEAGKRLILLKENEPHGEFTTIVEEQLGLAPRTARLMIQAAVKYSSPQLESKRQALAV